MAGYDGDWQERQADWSGAGRGDAPRTWGRRSRAGERGYRWMDAEPQPRASRRARGPGPAMPYDFGYQGGELGRPIGARGWGTHGSGRTPGYRASPGWDGEWFGAYRGDEYNAAYGRDYEYDDTPRRRAGPWSLRRGRGSEYGAADTGGDDFGRRLRRHYGRTPPDRWPAHDAAGTAGRMSDRDVLESVRENLFQDSFVDPERIQVQVERGIVTLRGDVDDFLEARYAWDDAWESPGVRGVINHLTVRTDRASEEMNMPQTSHDGGSE